MSIQSMERKVFAGVNFRDFKYAASKESDDNNIQTGITWQAEFGEAFYIKNVRLNPSGGFSSRRGRITIGTVVEDIHTLSYFQDNTGIEYAIIGAGDKIYVDPGITGTCDPLLTYDFGDGLAYKAKTVNAFKFLFYVDGQRGNLKFDGNDWTQLGITAPSSAPTVAVDPVVGSLNGSYTYFYLYIALNAPLGYTGESQRSPISSSVSPSSEKVNVTLVASADPQVTGIRLYRLGGTSAEWKQVGSDLTNTNQVYSDNIADADLGSVLPSDYDLGAPIDETLTSVKFNGVTQFGNRLVGWSGGILWYTVPGKPEKFWNNIEGSDVTTQPITMDPENGQSITGCEEYRNMLVMYTKNKMGTLFDDGGIGLSFIMKNWGMGCPYPRTIKAIRGWLFWLSDDGLFKWDGANFPVHISAKVDYDNNALNRGIYDSPSQSLANACAIYSKKDQAYWLSLPDYSSNENQRTLIYDLRMERAGLNPWSVYDFGFSDGFNVEDGRMFTSGSYRNNGIDKKSYIEENSGVQDDGSDFDVIYETRHSDFGNSRMDKRFIEISVNCYTIYNTITMHAITDLGGEVFTFDTEPSGERTNEAITNESVTASQTGDFLMENFRAEDIGLQFGFRVEMGNGNIFYSFDTLYKLVRRARTI